MANEPQQPSGSLNVDGFFVTDEQNSLMSNDLQSIELTSQRVNSPLNPRHNFLASIENAQDNECADISINYANQLANDARARQRKSSSAPTETITNTLGISPDMSVSSLQNVCIQNQTLIKQQGMLLQQLMGQSTKQNTPSATMTRDPAHRVSSDESGDDMDAFVNQRVMENDDDDTDEHGNEHDDIQRSLQEFFDDSDQCGPEIDPKLANCLSKAFHVKVADDKAKKLADLYHKPKNSENFHVPKTNDSVWSSVKRRTQDVDVKLQHIQSQQLKALFPLIRAFDKMLEGAKTGKGLKQEQNSECIKLVQHSIQLSQMAFNELSYRRRYLIRGDLKHCYKQLCNDRNPITQFLLGDNVENKMKDIDVAKKLGHRITDNQRKPYYNNHHPTSGNRGRYHPYTRGGKQGFHNNRKFRNGGKDFSHDNGSRDNNHFLGEKEGEGQEEQLVLNTLSVSDNFHIPSVHIDLGKFE